MELLSKHSTLKKKVLSGGSWALTGKFLSVAMGLTLNILLARYLSPGELGIYFLIISIISFTNAVGTLGLQQNTVRFIAERVGKDSRAISEYLSSIPLLVFFSSIIVSLVTYLAVILYSSYSRNTYLAVLNNISISLIFLIIIAVFQKILAEIYRGFSDIRLFTLLSGSTLLPTEGILPRGMLLGGVILIISWGVVLKLELVIRILIFSIIVSILLTLLIFIKDDKKINFFRISIFSNYKDKIRTAGNILSNSWPYLVSNILLFVIVQSDIWLVSLIDNPSNTALYGTAKRFISLWIMPALIIRTFIAPFVAELYAKKDIPKLEKLIKSSLTLVIFPVFFTLIPIIIWGDHIIGFLFGDYYTRSYLLILILIIHVIIAIFGQVGEEILFMTGNQKVPMTILFLTGFLLIVSGWFAVTYLGVLGMVISFTASMFIKNILILYFVKKKTGLTVMFTTNYKLVLSNVLEAVRQ